MATSPYSSDIVLSKTDGSTNKIGLKLFRDAPNVPGGWRIDHVSPAPPRQASDSANYQQQSPDIGLVLDQDSWHRGFGLSTFSRFGTAITTRLTFCRISSLKISGIKILTIP